MVILTGCQTHLNQELIDVTSNYRDVHKRDVHI